MGLPKLNLGYLFFYKSWYSGRGNDSFWSQELLVLPVETGSDPSPADLNITVTYTQTTDFVAKAWSSGPHGTRF